MTRGERPGPPPLDDVVGAPEQLLGEQLERLGDEHGHGRRHLPDVLVRLHYLLDSGLENKEEVKHRNINISDMENHTGERLPRRHGKEARHAMVSEIDEYENEKKMKPYNDK